jgi:hypothetical protein
MPKIKGELLHNLFFDNTPIPHPFDNKSSFQNYLDTVHAPGDVHFPFPGTFKQFFKICLKFANKKPEDIQGEIAYYALTNQVFKTMSIEQTVPADIIQALQAANGLFKDKKGDPKKFDKDNKKSQFLQALTTCLGEEKTKQYKQKLLTYATHMMWKRSAIVNFMNPKRPHPTRSDLVNILYDQLEVERFFKHKSNSSQAKIWFYLFANCNRDVDYIYERQRGAIPQISSDILHMATELNKVSPEQQEICLRFIQTTLDEKITPERQDEYPLEQCAVENGFELPTLEKWVRTIERKKQAIFYGPPGTGKTYIAEQLARHLIGGGDGFTKIVQFHPAYAYEDFIQGIRPKARNDGGLDYPTIPGRFLEFCREAQARNDRCVLIIDEINRANLARVFGELMYLLEYRDRKVPLAGGNTLFIPENVRIIGTMNTADRSIALVDYALRRRFAFLALYPDYNVLRHYHERRQTGLAVNGLINVLKQLNRQIGDQHYEIGISFFLHENLSEVIEDIWRMEIEPYLEEFFFDQSAKVDEFRWEKKRKEILS